MSTVNATSTRSKREMTRLLENETLARLSRMRLQPVRRRTNRTHGEHLAGKGGVSTEFADYRDYVPGDDTRFVDWNIFFRLQRPYVKLFRLEEVMHVVIVIDSSNSMQFEDKLLRAQQLAAAFGVMGVMAMERVSIYVCGDSNSGSRCLSPCTGRASMRRMFDFLELEQSGGDCSFDQAIDKVLARHTGRGIAVLLSDFLTFGNIQRGFNMLYSAGLEAFAVQILGPSEISPELDGDVRLVDSESGASLDISSAGDLLGFYQEQRRAYESQLAAACRQRNGRFLSIGSHVPLREVVFDQLLRQGWMR